MDIQFFEIQFLEIQFFEIQFFEKTMEKPRETMQNYEKHCFFAFFASSYGGSGVPNRTPTY